MPLPSNSQQILRDKLPDQPVEVLTLPKTKPVQISKLAAGFPKSGRASIRRLNLRALLKHPKRLQLFQFYNPRRPVSKRQKPAKPQKQSQADSQHHRPAAPETLDCHL